MALEVLTSEDFSAPSMPSALAMPSRTSSTSWSTEASSSPAAASSPALPSTYRRAVMVPDRPDSMPTSVARSAVSSTTPARLRRERAEARSAASAGSVSAPPSNSETSHSAWADTNSLTAKAPERAGTTVHSRSLMAHMAASASALARGVSTTATFTARGGADDAGSAGPASDAVEGDVAGDAEDAGDSASAP